MGSSASKRKNLYSDFIFLTKHKYYDINLNKFLWKYLYKPVKYEKYQGVTKKGIRKRIKSRNAVPTYEIFHNCKPSLDIIKYISVTKKAGGDVKSFIKASILLSKYQYLYIPSLWRYLFTQIDKYEYIGDFNYYVFKLSLYSICNSVLIKSCIASCRGNISISRFLLEDITGNYTAAIHLTIASSISHYNHDTLRVLKYILSFLNYKGISNSIRDKLFLN